jgi:hypothetical protein
MAGWLEGIEESAFKSVPGGQTATDGVTGRRARPRYYLVNDAQKALIKDCLHSRVRFALVMILPSLVVVFALVAASIVYFRQAPLPPILIGVSASLLLLISLLIVPHVYLMQMLGPIIKDLPLTDQRFTTREQFSHQAGAVPKWLLYVGMIAGMGVILGGLIGIYDLWSEGRLAGRWSGQVTSVIGGTILAGYFMYLARLKKT